MVVVVAAVVVVAVVVQVANLILSLLHSQEIKLNGLAPIVRSEGGCRSHLLTTIPVIKA